MVIKTIFVVFARKISVFFLPKKRSGGGGGERICGCPSGHIFGDPLDRKQTFFKGGLTSVTYLAENKWDCFYLVHTSLLAEL